MENNTYCVIMAGGAGTRFWPISRSTKPKQFLDILGTGKTFLQSTYDRFAALIPDSNFLVVTNTAYKELVLEQLPNLTPEQVLCEPLGRSTAPCIAYASFRLKAVDPDATMIVTPADHLVMDSVAFRQVVTEAAQFASNNDALVTIGVKPTHPATGYGYIQIEKPINLAGMNRVKTFTEKPSRELATVFVESGDFFWNSGIFVWRVGPIMESLERHLPETYQLFESGEGAYGTDDERELIERIYPECRNISIDYGVMEKAENVYVRCGDFGWSDIGTWGSLYRYSQKDLQGNTCEPAVILFDTGNCVIKLPEGKIAVIEGLKDYIVVDTHNVLMICPKSNEQNIKKFIETVKFEKGDEYI